MAATVARYPERGTWAAWIAGLAFFAGWVQFLYTCVTEDQWAWAIAGMAVPPVGIVGGIGTWLGLW
jgi:hypothetical protein